MKANEEGGDQETIYNNLLEQERQQRAARPAARRLRWYLHDFLHICRINGCQALMRTFHYKPSTCHPHFKE